MDLAMIFLVRYVTRTGEEGSRKLLYSMYLQSLMPLCSSRLSIRIVADEQEQAGSMPKGLLALSPPKQG
jgi:hypothetical protein